MRKNKECLCSEAAKKEVCSWYFPSSFDSNNCNCLLRCERQSRVYQPEEEGEISDSELTTPACIIDHDHWVSPLFTFLFSFSLLYPKGNPMLPALLAAQPLHQEVWLPPPSLEDFFGHAQSSSFLLFSFFFNLCLRHCWVESYFQNLGYILIIMFFGLICINLNLSCRDHLVLLSALHPINALHPRLMRPINFTRGELFLHILSLSDLLLAPVVPQQVMRPCLTLIHFTLHPSPVGFSFKVHQQYHSTLSYLQLGFNQDYHHVNSPGSRCGVTCFALFLCPQSHNQILVQNNSVVGSSRISISILKAFFWRGGQKCCWLVSSRQTGPEKSTCHRELVCCLLSAAGVPQQPT
ncbi:hypothetical protein VP01_1510g3 [Puccinia sorghi]|uniref:Uncharacterized protein n=1 Tax=Puccinia sorghi TaxID=27349 RepID=A0A0L6VJ36_9BASI|nr:hypothetical protein VP01_1510g3 [Puccinia sorghi]